jgi:hypothetical protein
VICDCVFVRVPRGISRSGGPRRIGRDESSAACERLPYVAAANAGANWLDKILTRKHTRKVAAAANIIYYAGLILAAMRGLRDEMKSLLEPLRTFNPTDWPDERRAPWIAQLGAFAYGVATFGQMRGHAETLRTLTVEPEEDVVPLRDKIVTLASNVAHLEEPDQGGTSAEISARAAALSWDAALDEYHRRGLEEEGGGVVIGGPDALVQWYLPALVWLVRHADTDHPEQIKALRGLAHGLLNTRSEGGDRPLQEVVQEAETTFGRLAGLLVEKYPDLPRPTWAEPPTT